MDFYFTLVNAAKKWDKATPGAKVIYASGKSGTDDAGEIAAIQNMVAQGVKGIAITPTSPAVSAALDKAIKAGVKVVLMDNDIPAWKKKSSVVATNNFKGGQLAGKYLAKKLKAGDTLGVLEGNPANPALVERVTGMLSGLGAMKSKIKVVSKLETDCDQTKGATAAQTILTANPGLTAMYSACGPPALGAIQSIKNAGIKPGEIILVGFDASPRRGEGDQGRNRDRQRGAVPGQDRRARHRDAVGGGAGQEGAEERRHGHRARDEGQREQVLARARRRTSPAPDAGPGDGAGPHESDRSSPPRDRRRASPLLEPRAGGHALDDGRARVIRAHVRAGRPGAAARARGRVENGARAGRVLRSRHGLHVRARRRGTSGSAA